MQYGEIRGRPEDLELFADEPAALAPQLPRQVRLDPDHVEQGLVQLVLSVIELIRQLMEKQALRRIEGGGLSAEQVEGIGTTLLRLEEQMERLKEHFGLDTLDINLGPLGHLLDEPDTAARGRTTADRRSRCPVGPRRARQQAA